MKITKVGLVGFALGLGLCSVSGTPAEKDRDRDELKRTLNEVPVPELPARAADLVTAAQPDQRARVTEDVLEAAIASRPAAASSVVGAIIRANPSVATIAATTAVKLQPEQRSAVELAATTAAPDQSQKIVTALNKDKKDNNGQGGANRSDQGNAHAGGQERHGKGPPAFERPVGKPSDKPGQPGKPAGRPPGHYERP